MMQDWTITSFTLIWPYSSFPGSAHAEGLIDSTIRHRAFYTQWLLLFNALVWKKKMTLSHWQALIRPTVLCDLLAIWQWLAVLEPPCTCISIRPTAVTVVTVVSISTGNRVCRVASCCPRLQPVVALFSTCVLFRFLPSLTDMHSRYAEATDVSWRSSGLQLVFSADW